MKEITEVLAKEKEGADCEGFQTDIEKTSCGDVVGAATLELLETHDAYSQLIWERLGALGELKGKVFEIGCGIGTFSRMILGSSRVSLLHSVDVDPNYVDKLRARINDPRFEVFCSSAETFIPPDIPYDVAISSNVFEHIKNDAAAMEIVEQSLVPGGEFWILVPAHPSLFSGLDADLSHFRRYTRRSLIELAENAGLVPERIFHFNPVGALGWFFTGKILRRKTLPEGQVSFYDRFGIALSRIMDRCNPFPFGISLIARLRKPLSK